MQTVEESERSFKVQITDVRIRQVTKEGKILMVRQYRNAIDRFTLEIPAGAFDTTNESGAVCVARELEEETGYKAGSVEWLITTRRMVAFCNEKVEIFVAIDLIPSEQHLDEGEFVEVVEYTIDELVEMVYNSTIQDSKTISAIMTYYNKYCK